MRKENVSFIGFITIILVITLSACSGTATDDLLSGDFMEIDRSAPKIVYPSSEEKVTGLETMLAWSQAFAAIEYTVEISRDKNFNTFMEGAPFVTGDTSLTVQFPDAYTYYWRVRADTTLEGEYSAVGTVHVFDDVLYVYCPSSDTECSNSYTNEAGETIQRSGNKSDPYRKIGPVLTEAKSLGFDVHVAARGKGKYYDETITLLDGVSLYGGYSGSDWSRDIDANETKISGGRSKVLYGRYLDGDKEFTVDGFTLATTSTEEYTYVVHLEKVGSPLTLSHNTILGNSVNGTGTEDYNYGIYLKESAPDIKDNEITGGGAGDYQYALYLEGSEDVQIKENSIAGCTASPAGAECYGIYSTGSSWHIEGNTVYGNKDTADAADARGIYNKEASSGNIINNSIYGGSAASSCGIYNTTMESVSIKENKIYAKGGGSGSFSTGITVSSLQAFTIEKNIIDGGDNNNSKGIDIYNSSGNLVINNLISGGRNNIVVGINLTSSSGDIIANNTIYADTGALSFIVYLNNEGDPILRNNMLYTLKTGTCIYENNATGDPQSLLNNNFIGCGTLYHDNGGSDLTAINDVNTASNTTQLGSETSTGNISIDNSSGQLFVNTPLSTVITANGDGDGSYEGTVSSAEINDCADFTAGEYIEYDNDGTAREITGCSGYIVSFTPSLSSASEADKAIRLWGSSSDTALDWHLNTADSTICNAVYGALDLSSSFNTDFDDTARTANLSGIGCAPDNTGAAGWSMGAFERD